MKSSKIWKIIWVSGIYLILLTILYLVVVYKVKWEDKDLNTYLYLYDCNHHLCTSRTPQNDYYNKVLCNDDNCPYITNIIDNNIILNDGHTSWIYNYITGKIVNNTYKNYEHIGNNTFVITDNQSNQGVIDIEGNILVETKYSNIDDYRNGFIEYTKNNLHGIDTKDDKYKVDAKFEDIVLINDKIFAGKTNNIYRLYSYNDINNENANTYNYVYAYKDIILVANNNKIDILNNNLESTLLMKIDSFYEYKTEKERESLDFYFDKENIYFKVYIDETTYVEYKYNIKDKKII